MKGIKYIETMKLTIKKTTIDADKKDTITTFKTVYFNGEAKTIINEDEINGSIQTSNEEILNRISVWLSEGSRWTVESVDEQYLNIVRYNTLNGSSYIELPPELRNPTKGLINPRNEDNECFRWCHIPDLNPQQKDPQRIKKSDIEHIEKLDYAGIKSQ